MRTCACAVALVVCCAWMCLGDEGQPTLHEVIEAIDKQAKVDAKEASEVLGKEVVGVYVGRLLREYKENVVAADKRYKGKLLLIRGMVNRIDKCDDDTPYMIVTAPELVSVLGDHDDFAVCRYKTEHDAQLQDKKKDDVAIVMGVCLGHEDFIGERHVILDDCGTSRAEYWEKLPEYQEKNKERLAAEAKAASEAAEKSANNRAEADEREAEVGLASAKKLMRKRDRNGALNALWRVANKYPKTKAGKEALRLNMKLRKK